MVLGAFLAISLLTAVGICAGTGAFYTLSWLWVLPVSFAGAFLGLLLLLFLLMLIMAAAVDMEKPQEKDSAFYRTVVMGMIHLVVPLLRVRIVEKGMEQAPKEGRFLLVCNHLHEIDPVVLLRAFPKSRLAFVSKREVDHMFLVGKFLHKMLGQPINRENDREALRTILNCIQILDDNKASVAVFPEGYVSSDKLLHPLRNGVFKIAQRAKVPVVVCTLRDTHKVLKNALKLKPSTVEMRLVGVLGVDQITGKTAVQIGDMVYKMMADDLGPELVLQQ